MAGRGAGRMFHGTEAQGTALVVRHLARLAAGGDGGSGDGAYSRSRHRRRRPRRRRWASWVLYGRAEEHARRCVPRGAGRRAAAAGASTTV